MKDLSITLISAVLSGAITSGVIITIILLLLSKFIKKSKQSKLAKEFKEVKEKEFIIANIKQLNSHLQLENTEIAKKLNSFNIIDKEIVANFVLAQKSKKQELNEKDKKKAIKFKI